MLIPTQKMNIEVCSACAKGALGCVSCCISPFIEKDPGFWLTLSDIARIVKKTGMEPEEFCRLTTVEDGEDEGDVDEKYGELIYVGDKVILMSGKDKRCVFLTDNGCSIFDVRPKMCRIHPFWFEEKNGNIKITIEDEEDANEDECYLTKTNRKRDIGFLLRLMNETEESMKECIREYIDEMKMHNKLKHQLEKKPIMDVLIENGLLK
jgi:Fe-S-cluster containining protein